MNYRHAFHAGNHADVLKHAVLALLIEHLKRKPAPFAVLDTHAGAGLYDLGGDEAARSPEWRGGVGRVRDWADPPDALRPYLQALGPEPSLYPGSPALALGLLRDPDRLIACELHGPTAAALKAAFKGEARVQIHQRDGYEALGALLPFPERRGLVLIDPPYEDRLLDLQRAVRAIAAALPRFPGPFLWWRPLKDAAELDRADAGLRQLAPDVPALRVDFWVDTPQREGPLAGSSLAVIHPPYRLDESLAALLPPLAARLALAPAAGWRVWR